MMIIKIMIIWIMTIKTRFKQKHVLKWFRNDLNCMGPLVPHGWPIAKPPMITHCPNISIELFWLQNKRLVITGLCCLHLNVTYVPILVPWCSLSFASAWTRTFSFHSTRSCTAMTKLAIAATYRDMLRYIFGLMPCQTSRPQGPNMYQWDQWAEPPTNQ